MNVSTSLLFGLFIFVMVAIILGAMDAALPMFLDNTILTIAFVLGVVTATYNIVKQ